MFHKEEPHYVSCNKCERELYCSNECREKAWDSYHEILCIGNNPSSDHPMLKLEDLAR